VGLVKADATALPFPDATFDAAASIQVYEYVADLSTALAELHRVLRPGGRALILDTDWDSIVWHATDTNRMRRLLAAWTQRFADPHLPRSLASQLRAAGFKVDQPQVLVLLNPDYRPDTYSIANGEIMADFAVTRLCWRIREWSGLMVCCGLDGVRWCTPRVHEVVGDVDAAKAQPCGSGDDRAGRAGGVPKGLPADPDP
jgi:SAM-dependent methyltransferase